MSNSAPDPEAGANAASAGGAIGSRSDEPFWRHQAIVPPTLRLGAKRVLGVDGERDSRNTLEIRADCFRLIDLASARSGDLDPLGGLFDLVVSIEVAEHLLPDSASGFAEVLCSVGDKVLFSRSASGRCEPHERGLAR